MDCGIIIVILIIIIAILAAYIFLTKGAFFGNEENKETLAKAEDKALLVLDDISYKESEEDETLVLRVKNTSSKAFNNVTPVLIYYSDNIPVHEAWGARVSYFAPGDSRCIRFYDTIKDYDKVEIGMFDREDKATYTDLRDKIEYEVEKSDTPDENGEIKLTFKGENKYDKAVSADFEIAYYSEGKLIYEDQFSELIDANGSFDTYEYYRTKFYDGTKFPEGYTYEVTLVEAVEDIDIDENEIDIPEDTIEDKVESAIFKRLKELYGDDMASAKIYVDKTYTAEQAKNIEGVKDLNLGENDVAFEVSIHIEPAEGADIMRFTVPDGEYNEETGWVNEIHRLGVLKQKNDGKYEITNYGTGW